MLWAQRAKKPPRIIAEMILNNLEDPHGLLARKEIAGPGFLNFTFSPQFYYQRLRELAEAKEGNLDIGRGRKVQIELPVSTRPVPSMSVMGVWQLSEMSWRGCTNRSGLRLSANTTSMTRANRWRIWGDGCTRVIKNCWACRTNFL